VTSIGLDAASTISSVAEEIPVQLARARRRRRWQLAAMVAMLIISAAAAVMIGPVRIGLNDVAAFVAGDADATTRTVIGQIRLPRIALGMLVGAGLAVAGATMQGLFRNPLADPGLIGISAGAAFGAVSVIVLGHRLLPALPGWAAPYLLSIAAFAGCLAAMILMVRLSLHEGQPVVATMLLAGVAINALASAMTAFVIFGATDQQIRDVTFWLLGSLGGASWPKVLAMIPCITLGLALLPLLSRALNALLLGESEAAHLGFPVARVKWIAITLSALMVGSAVAFAGVIGFVGLVVPHAVRLAAGPDHRFLLPASAILGAALVVTADLLARSVVAPAELPIGILTAIIGAPFFLWLLLRAKAAWQA
jgi:iron complex transport system permease protein